MLPVQILALALSATAHARTIHLQDLKLQPYIIDVAHIAQDEFEDVLSEQPFESIHPVYLNRVRRQLGSLSTNSSSTNTGNANLNLKVPLARSDNNVSSAVGSVFGLQSTGFYKAADVKPGLGYGSAGGGLASGNINGNNLRLTGQHIPNHLTEAGRVMGFINSDAYKLRVNAFINMTMPNIPNLPNFNTRAGSLDYTYRDKVGASLGISKTDLFRKTDYAAMGNLNLFRSPGTSLDLNAGLPKSLHPSLLSTAIGGRKAG